MRKLIWKYTTQNIWETINFINQNTCTDLFLISILKKLISFDSISTNLQFEGRRDLISNCWWFWLDSLVECRTWKSLMAFNWFDLERRTWESLMALYWFDLSEMIWDLWGIYEIWKSLWFSGESGERLEADEAWRRHCVSSIYSGGMEIVWWHTTSLNDRVSPVEGSLFLIKTTLSFPKDKILSLF